MHDFSVWMPRLEETRLTSVPLLTEAHITAVNRYNNDLKTGKVKANKNPAGLLLVTLGLRPPKAPKPV